MKVLIQPGKAKNVLATIAIGAAYYKAWEKFALPGWESYCHRHQLGLVVFDQDLLPLDAPKWKKATANAQPRDIVDIVVSEPIAIRVQPTEKK